MTDNLLMWGATPDLLDEEFVGTSGDDKSAEREEDHA